MMVSPIRKEATVTGLIIKKMRKKDAVIVSMDDLKNYGRLKMRPDHRVTHIR